MEINIKAIAEYAKSCGVKSILHTKPPTVIDFPALKISCLSKDIFEKNFEIENLLTSRFNPAEVAKINEVLTRKHKTNEEIQYIMGLKNTDGELLNHDEVVTCLGFKNFGKLVGTKSCDIDKLTPIQKGHLFDGLVNAFHSGMQLDKITNLLPFIDDLIKPTNAQERLDSYVKLIRKLCKEMSPDGSRLHRGCDTLPAKMQEELYKTAIPSPQTDLSKLARREEVCDGITNITLRHENNESYFAVVHAIGNEHNYPTLLGLTKTGTNQVFSASLIKPSDTNTFHNIKNGFVFNTNSKSILILSKHDLDSGCGARTYREMLDFLLKQKPKEKSYISDLIKNLIKSEDTEYAQRLQRLKCCKTLEEAEALDPTLIAAYKKVLEENKTFEFLIHNPTVKAFFTKEPTLKEVPLYIREMANENGLPIVFID